MIYVCIPVHNEARTAGLVLWKVRQVFTAFPREYQLLVLDDASTDDTHDVLASYGKVLPMTIVTHRERRGYAKSLEELLRLALQRTDRPKRDCAITLHADFVHSPESMEDMVKHLESGADLVVAELVQQRGRVSRALGLARPWRRTPAGWTPSPRRRVTTWCSARRASSRGVSCSKRGAPARSSARPAPWWRCSSSRSGCTRNRIARAGTRPCRPWPSSPPPSPPPPRCRSPSASGWCMGRATDPSASARPRCRSPGSTPSAASRRSTSCS